MLPWHCGPVIFGLRDPFILHAARASFRAESEALAGGFQETALVREVQTVKAPPRDPKLPKRTELKPRNTP